MRGRGVGRSLLTYAEREIRERGVNLLRLRLVKENTGALTFYTRCGWEIVREFPHEILSWVPMLELTKPSSSTGDR